MNNNQKPPMGAVLRSDGHWSTQGLVSCWLFNEGGGSVAYDIANNTKLAPVGNPVISAQGIKFSGSNYTKCEVADCPRLLFSGNKTVVTTITPYALPTSMGYAHLAGFSYINPNQPWSLQLYSDETQKIVFGSYNSTAGNKQVVGVKTLTLNTKSTLVGVYKNGVYFIYVNGILLAQATVTEVGQVFTSSQYSIGANNVAGTWGRFFNGTVHNQFIYNRALSADEIKQLHENPYQMVRDYQSPVTLPRTIDPSKNLWRMT